MRECLSMADLIELRIFYFQRYRWIWEVYTTE